MDAHLFRRFCRELAPRIAGGWLEKIQEPVPGLVSCHLTLPNMKAGRKVQLCLRADRKDPFLFLTSSRLAAGRAPSAPIMRLRKYTQGRRIMATVARFADRQLWLLMGGRSEAAEDAPGGKSIWVVLDLREGALLRFCGPEEQPQEDELRWPAPDELEEACRSWRDWPVLTPALRRALPFWDPLDRQALLEDLRLGDGDLFFYRPDAEQPGEPPCRLSAWPLPAPLLGKAPDHWHEQVEGDILGVVEQAGKLLALDVLARQASDAAALPLTRRSRKLSRLLDKLHEEEARLDAMCAARDKGLALQAELWRWPADFRADAVELCPDAEGRARVLALDPRHTVRENMARFFHTARRGERGRVHLEERRRLLERELAALEAARESARHGGPVPDAAADTARAPLPDAVPRNVQLFVSEDGFVLLRGRDAKGNLAARKLAAPHDIWLHADGGPGSHVIIRRAHAGQDIPERTLDQAGGLAANKSWQRDAARARILYAEVRHIRSLRGAAPGTVRMDKIWLSREVPVDPSLELRLLPGEAEDPASCKQA